MKKLILFFILLGSLLSSCTENSPKAVAEKFLTAYFANDFIVV